MFILLWGSTKINDESTKLYIRDKSCFLTEDINLAKKFKSKKAITEFTKLYGYPYKEIIKTGE